jgi:hypothetical protein
VVSIKPRQHRSWIPRDPDFGSKAARVLDLYARRFDDTPLRSDEFLSTGSKAAGPPCARCACPSTPHGSTRWRSTRSKPACWPSSSTTSIATPFEWKSTKNDLNALLDRVAAHEDALRALVA